MSDFIGDSIMARSPFSLYKRRGRYAGHTCYYVQFWDPEHRKYMVGRSINGLIEELNLDPKQYPSNSKAAARMVANLWLSSGKPYTKKKDMLLGDYCLTFWDWEKSPYIKSQKLRQKSIGKEYVQTSLSYIKRFLTGHTLAKAPLSAITPGMLEGFMMEIKERTTLSNKSCNEILRAISRPLSEAARLGMIKESPTNRVQKLGNTCRRKGLLSSQELKALFQRSWPDDRVYTAALVSLTCGLRLGEILAIRQNSIQDGYLLVTASFSKIEGIKGTKNGQERLVALPDKTQQLLTALIKKNPYAEDFAFWSSKPGVPMSASTVAKAFVKELDCIGITDTIAGNSANGQSRKERNISFHSLRHLHNTLLRGAITDCQPFVITAQQKPDMMVVQDLVGYFVGESAAIVQNKSPAVQINRFGMYMIRSYHCITYLYGNSLGWRRFALIDHSVDMVILPIHLRQKALQSIGSLT
jgi:integrase